MHDQSQSHVLTPTRDRESIMLAVRRPRSPTAQSDIYRPFQAAPQRHQRTGIGTDRVRLSAGLTRSLSYPPAPPATDVPTLVVVLDILQMFNFMGHTFTASSARACCRTWRTMTATPASRRIARSLAGAMRARDVERQRQLRRGCAQWQLQDSASQEQ